MSRAFVPPELLARFIGPAGRAILVDTLRRQVIVDGDLEFATAVADVATVEHFPAGGCLIRQDAFDSHLYLILAGEVSVQVHGREIARREGRCHVGDMGLIDPTIRRCASVVAVKDTVAARLEEPVFTDLAGRFPHAWRLLARELGDRLRQRNRLVEPKNCTPVLFVGSSSEALPVARSLQNALDHDPIDVHLWTTGIFTPGHYPVDDLLAQVRKADFAVLVFAADDQVISRGSKAAAPRDNVLCEISLFMGALGRERALMLMPRGSRLKVPSDFLGLTPIQYLPGTPAELVNTIGPAADELRRLISNLGCK